MLNRLYKKICELYIWLKAVVSILNAKTLNAQYTIYALFMTVLTLIAFVAVYPLLDELVVQSGITGIEGTLLTWTPLFIVLFILWSAVWYVNPRQQ